MENSVYGLELWIATFWLRNAVSNGISEYLYVQHRVLTSATEFKSTRYHTVSFYITQGQQNIE